MASPKKSAPKKKAAPAKKSASKPDSKKPPAKKKTSAKKATLKSNSKKPTAKKSASKPNSKKPPAKKKTPAKKAKPVAPLPKKEENIFYRSVISLIILVLIVLLAVFASNYFLKNNNDLTMETKIPIVRKTIRHQTPVFEVYSDDINDHPISDKTTSGPALIQQVPLVSIIIDDVGYDRRLAKKFMNISPAITLSILPHSPHQNDIATDAKNNGTDIMLHLPMEPLKYPAIDSGKGTLLSNMTPDELITQLEKNIQAVPYITGVNNHMGSKITANAPQIYQVFSILKKYDLFFVDSRTTNQSVCKPSARLFQLPFAERNVFLDNIHDKKAIRIQFEKLIKIAKREGMAVGIGHAYKITCGVLAEEIPKFKNQIKFVPASQVVRIIET